MTNDQINALVVWATKDFLRAKRLQVPLALATGLYEQLSDEEINDHHEDIHAELRRREQSVPN